MLSLIVARARNGAIGRDGTIPWHAPEDLAFFQRETMGGAIIMGRKTWESLPRRPLPRRLNVVVTARQMPEAENTVFTALETARDVARAAGHLRHYAIGGAAIYAAFLPLADRLLITEVDLDVPDADTFFPDLPPERWRLNAQMTLREAGPRCVLHEYLRC